MLKGNKYIIRYNELDNGLQTISFPIDSSFFEDVEGSEIVRGECCAILEVNKSLSSLRLNVKIEGYVIVECDRCLEEVRIAVNYNGKLFIRFSSEVEESEFVIDNNNEDTIIANANIAEVDMKEYLYDSIIISLPMQRSHPLDAPEGEGCNSEMLKHFGIIDNSNPEMEDDEWDEDNK